MEKNHKRKRSAWMTGISFAISAALALIVIFYWLGICPYKELGVPLAEAYPELSQARCPWDMALHDGKLYVGGGDYDMNAGPVPLWCYDTESGEWACSAVLLDEEIDRFCQWNGTLLIPGVDPMQDWELGNYYVLNDQGWETIRSIPGALHNFDMVQYDGRIFAGLGVKAGASPVAVSDDDGATFSPVPLYKDGSAVDTAMLATVRVYDLFVFHDALYAALLCGNETLSFGLYRYEEGAFVFDNDWLGKVYAHSSRYIYNMIAAKTEFCDRMFFTTGILYVTDDMRNVERVRFPSEELVCDLYLENDTLYALCTLPRKEGGYRVSVWANESGGNEDFVELVAFDYKIMPLSLVVDGDIFYLGMGNRQIDHEKNGMILMVDRTDQ